MKRVFVAINLQDKIKNKLSEFQKNIESEFEFCPIKWAKKDSFHITLLFLGSVKSEQIPEVIKIVKRIALQNPVFSMNLNKICYAPIGVIPPKMIWIKSKKNEQAVKIKKEMEKEFLNLNISSFRAENRNFIPHITLGRIKQWDWRGLDQDEKPKIENDISLNFQIKSIDVMESRLKRSGAEHTILQTCELKKKA